MFQGIYKRLLFYDFMFYDYDVKKIDQIINRQQATNCLGVFDHFVGLALNPFVPNAPFLYPLKTSEKALRFSDIFRG